jgi:hypothetical protein
MPGGHKGSRLSNLKAQRELAGFGIEKLARATNLSDRIIVNLEDGGNLEDDLCARIATTLSVSLVTLGQRQL